jgi:hypothetical protein
VPQRCRGLWDTRIFVGLHVQAVSQRVLVQQNRAEANPIERTARTIFNAFMHIHKLTGEEEGDHDDDHDISKNYLAILLNEFPRISHEVQQQSSIFC